MGALEQRVKKVAGSTTTVFLYDFDGNIIGAKTRCQVFILDKIDGP
jgi:hypothetical protein